MSAESSHQTDQNSSPWGPRLLLFMEWPLLGNAMLAELVASRFRSDYDPIHNLICLAALGAMRVWLPTRVDHRIVYTLLEFALLLVPCFLGHFRPQFFVFPSLIVVIRSCILFQREIRGVITGLTFSLFVVLQFLQPTPLRFLIPLAGRPSLERLVDPSRIEAAFLELRLTSVLLYGMILVFVLLATSALLAEYRSRHELALAHEKLKHYALRIEGQAALQERNRIAREIHDSLGHALTAQSIQLQNALEFLPDQVDKAQSFLEAAYQLGSTALGNIRQSVATLRADPWRHRSLHAEIITLLKNFHQATGILPESTLEWRSPLSAEVCIAVYRIVQESLTNIAKHSQATQVQLHIQQEQEGLKIQIADTGRGFDPAQNRTGFGLQGMEERVRALQGSFQLSSQPGQGCTLTIHLPLQEHA